MSNFAVAVGISVLSLLMIGMAVALPFGGLLDWSSLLQRTASYRFCFWDK